MPDLVRPAAVPANTYATRNQEFNTRNRDYLAIRRAMIESLREIDVENMKHVQTGMRDITPIQIIANLEENLGAYTKTDIEEMIDQLHNGIEFEVESGFKVMSKKFKIIFDILANNANTISEMQKIQVVEDALRRIKCSDVNATINDWNRTHGQPARRVYDIFERDMHEAFLSISKNTLKNAGYTAYNILLTTA